MVYGLTVNVPQWPLDRGRLWQEALPPAKRSGTRPWPAARATGFSRRAALIAGSRQP